MPNLEQPISAGRTLKATSAGTAITDTGLAPSQAAYSGEVITKEDLFYYIYGLLHLPDYRSRYADNLGKEIPRIPAVKTAADFRAFSEAGCELAFWHLNYETVAIHPGIQGDTPLVSQGDTPFVSRAQPSRLAVLRLRPRRRDLRAIIKGGGRPAHQHQRKNQPTGTTKARHANPWQSRSATVAFWCPASSELGICDDWKKVEVFENSSCQKESMAVPPPPGA